LDSGNIAICAVRARVKKEDVEEEDVKKEDVKKEDVKKEDREGGRAGGGGDRAKRADNPGLTNPSFRFLF
jgi:hypothetical protein